MADEEVRDGAGKGVRHFDMNEIAKAEKDRKRRKKQKRENVGDVELAEKENGGGFQMPVDDPRFGKLYESHEFAIDPNDSRFKATEGMKALLEESRRRGKRKAEAHEEREIGREKGKKSKKDRTNAYSDKTDENVMKLVQKIKGRAPIA